MISNYYRNLQFLGRLPRPLLWPFISGSPSVGALEWSSRRQTQGSRKSRETDCGFRTQPMLRVPQTRKHSFSFKMSNPQLNRQAGWAWSLVPRPLA